MGKYGTNLDGFGAYEGGVNADKGAPLVSTSSDGETSLLFGPAALREIQTGVANGDFAIAPDAAGSNLAADNALPYWTLSTTGSTCSAAIVADSSQGSGNALRITVGAGSGGSLTLTRYIPLPGTRAQTFCVQPVITLGGASNNTDAEFYASGQQFDANLTSIASTTVTLNTLQFNSFTGTTKKLLPDSDQVTTWKSAAVASNAAFYKITLVFQNTGTTAANRTIDLYDVRLLMGSTDLTVAETTTPATYGPTWIRQTNGTLIITPDVSGSGGLSLPNSTLSQYDKGGSADTTTITTAGTYYALTNAEASFTPQFVGQRWLLTMTGYASLNTTTIQQAFVRSDVTDSSNVNITTLGYSRSENFGTTGRGGTVAFTKVWVADRTTACKFKLYGTAQTTNGLVLSLAYTQMTAYPIG